MCKQLIAVTLEVDKLQPNSCNRALMCLAEKPLRAILRLGTAHRYGV